MQARKPIQKILEEFKDVIIAELPKRLAPRREVNHATELEPGAKPPIFAFYPMAPPKLEGLRRKLKELLDIQYILPSKSPYGVLVLF